MTIQIQVYKGKAKAIGPFPFAFLKAMTGLAGRKVWNGSASVTFEASGANVRTLNNSGLDLAWTESDKELTELRSLEGMRTQHGPKPFLELGAYQPRQPLFPHQEDALAISLERESYAYLLEMGLGKTAIAIAKAGWLYTYQLVSGVLIVAPKGVHRQWIEEQIPEHLSEDVQAYTLLWKGKEFDTRFLARPGLTFLAMNTDAIRTPAGFRQADAFLRAHLGRAMMIVDESHLIKSWTAARTKAAWELGRLAKYRVIMTGTPIAKNLLDAWSQFKFLTPKILGHNYITSFRTRYCIMGGWEGKEIVGHRNVEEFYSLIAPHSYMMTKAKALKLPPKMYAVRPYEMGEATAKHYHDLKKTLMTELDNGTIVDVPSVAVALVRMQQLLCGYLTDPEGRVTVISDERLQVLKEIIDQVEGPVIIWSRYVHSIRMIEAFLRLNYGSRSVVTYMGETSPAERETALDRFLGRSEEERARFFVSNPAAGGTGLNLQGECTTNVYFSNSFNALERWQSEDRTHRLGTIGTITYFDIVASRSIDSLILRNLRDKKSLSDLALVTIREALSGD